MNTHRTPSITASSPISMQSQHWMGCPLLAGGWHGISSLLGGLAEEPAIVHESQGLEPGNDEFSFINEGLITRNPYQPRKEFDEAALAEMVEDVAEHGVLQPLLVRPYEGGYQLIAGERRLLAARRAGLTKVPCRSSSSTTRESAKSRSSRTCRGPT